MSAEPVGLSVPIILLRAALVALCLAPPALANPVRPSLAIGDTAPPLAVERWLRGTPVGSLLTT